MLTRFKMKCTNFRLLWLPIYEFKAHKSQHTEYNDLDWISSSNAFAFLALFFTLLSHISSFCRDVGTTQLFMRCACDSTPNHKMDSFFAIVFFLCSLLPLLNCCFLADVSLAGGWQSSHFMIISSP